MEKKNGYRPELVDEIVSLSLLDAAALVKRWKKSLAFGSGSSPRWLWRPGAAAPVVEEKTEFQ